MKKFKGWIALMLAVVLVASNAIYSMSSALKANEIETQETGSNAVEEDVPEEPDINTEGVEVKEQTPVQNNQTPADTAQPVDNQQVQEPVAETARKVTFQIETDDLGKVQTLQNESITNGFVKETTDNSISFTVEPNDGYVAEVYSGADKIDISNGMYTSAAIADVTVTVKFIKLHTVNFVDWDETALSSQSVKDAASAVAPAEPSREGYKFLQWDMDFSTVTDDMTITAQYVELKKYTITVSYVFEDGRTAASPYIAEVEGGSGFQEMITLPNVDGYEVKKDGVAITEYPLNIDTVTSDYTETVTYEKIKIETGYTVKHQIENVDGTFTEEAEEKTAESGTTVTEQARVLDGYSADASEKSSYIKLDGINEITFKYVRNTYFVTFETNGDLIEPISAKYEAKVKLPSAKRDGFTFKGWADSKNAEDTYQAGEEISMPADGKSLTAIWEGKEVKYTAVYWIQDPDHLDEYFYVATVKDGGKGTAGQTAEINGSLPGTVTSALKGTYNMPENSYALNVGKTQEKNPQLLDGDGSGIVNYYIDRTEHELWFTTVYAGVNAKFLIDGVTSQTCSIKIRYGQDITDIWPTKYLTVIGDSNGYAFHGVDIGGIQYVNGTIIVDKRIWQQAENSSLADFLKAKIQYIKGIDVTINNYYENLPGDTSGTEYNGKNYKLNSSVQKTGSITSTWYTRETAQFKPQIEGMKVQLDKDGNPYVTFYYDRKSYDFTYTSNGKTENITYQFDAPIRKLENPANGKKGYTFEGWYTSEFFYDGTEFDLNTFKTMPANNVTIYAKWAAPTYKVTIDAQNGTENTVQKVTEGKTAVKPAEPTNGDAMFLGWYANGKPFSFDTKIDKDTTVTAKWKVNEYTSYTVRYVDESGNELKTPKQQKGITGAEVTEEAPAINGYTFDKSVQVIVLGSGKTNEIIFTYTKFATGSYTVNYVDSESGDTLAASKSVTDVKEVKVVENFVQIAGYTPDTAAKMLTLTSNAENNVITFYYTKNPTKEYKIEHYKQNLNGVGYALAETESKSAAIGIGVTASAKSYDGFTYASAISAGTSGGTITSGKDLTLKLYYTRDKYQYRVLYLEEGTNEILADAFTGMAFFEDTVSLNALSIPGYQASESTTEIIISNNSQMNQYIFYYTRADYDYSVNYLEDGTKKVLKAGTTGKQTFGKTVSAEADQTITIGDAVYELQGDASRTITIKADAELNVINFYYKQKTYSLTYDANEGKGTVPEDNGKYKVGDGASVLSGSSLTKKDAVLLGWSSDSSVKGVVYEEAPSAVIYTAGSSYTMPAADTTLYAVWAADKNGDGTEDYLQWTVTYDGNGADRGDAPTDNGLYGPGENVSGTAKDKGTLEKDGYIFKGWQIEGTGQTVNEGDSFPITGNTTLKAVWAQVFNTKYNANGGNGTVPTDIKSYEKDETVTVMPGLSLTHEKVDGKDVVFVGWSKAAIQNPLPDGSSDPAGLLTAGDNFQIAENTTLYAVWAIDENGNGTPDYKDKHVNISFEAGINGKISNGQTTSYVRVLTGLDFYETITVPEYEADAGYEFDKWTPNLPGNGSKTEEDVTYTVNFKPRQYDLKVTYQVHDSASIPEGVPSNRDETVTYGANYEVSVPVISGYTSVIEFQKGSELSGTMPIDGVEAVVTYHKDDNGNGTPDCEDAKYSVSFTAGDNGSINAGQTAEFADILEGLNFYDNVTVPEVTADAGYHFSGWDKELPAEDAKVTGNVVYTAQFAVNQYGLKVTYDIHDSDVRPDGIPDNRDEQVNYKATYRIEVPVITGYVSKVEYRTGAAQLEGTMPIGGVEVFVTYHKDENGNGTPDCEDQRFDVTFETGTNGSIIGADENGKVVIADILEGLTFGSQVTVPEAVPNEGYHFVGWTPSLPKDEAAITGNQSYTAVFAPNAYGLTVTYATDDGSVITGMPENYSEQREFNSKYAVEAPDFEGYITKVTGQLSGKIPTEGVVVNVVYQRDDNGNQTPDVEEEKYDITFSAGANGSINPDQQTSFTGILTGLKFYDKVTVPEVTPDRGYSFAGFTPKLPEKDTKVTKSVNYEAQFKVNQYALDVEYKVHEGKIENLPEDYTEAVTFNETYEAKVPEFDGYVATIEGAVSGVMSDAGAKVTVTYHKDENGNGKPDCQDERYDITFTAGANGAIKEGEKTEYKDILEGLDFYGQITVPKAEADNGYTFAGYTPVLPEEGDKVTGNVTYEAQFQINQYDLNVTYKVHDTDIIPAGIPADRTEKVTFKDSYSIEMPQISGYAAVAEYKQGAEALNGKMTVDGVEVIITYHKDENNNGKPDCEDEKYDITFKAGSHGTIAGANVDGEVIINDILEGLTFGTQVTVPQAVAEEGYHFTGWTPALPDSDAPINGDQTYTAVFAPNSYDLSVTYKTDDGSVIADMPGDYTNSLDFGTRYKVEVSDFEGYITKVTGVLKGKMPVGGVAVEVLYQRDENGNNIPDVQEERYDITFRAGANGNINLGEKTEFSDILTGLDFYKHVTVPNVTADPGYKFIGFTPELPKEGSKVQGSQEYVAEFKALKYDLTVNYEVHDYDGTPEGVPENRNESVTYKDYYEISVPDVKGFVAAVEYITGPQQLNGTMPINGIEVKVTYHKDDNGNGKPDCEETKVDVTFKAGTHGSISGADDNGTVVIKDVLEEMEFGKVVTVPEATPDTGYHFVGWTPELPKDSDKIDGSKNYNYTAVFAPNEYGLTVTYRTDDGSVIENMPADYSEQREYDTEYSVDTPDFEGYITKVTGETSGKIAVEGAVVDVLYQRDANGNQIPDAEEDKYDITFAAGEHGAIKDGEKTEFHNILTGLDFYDNVTVPAVDAEEGYTFTGWTPNLPEQGDKVTGSVSYTAEFTANAYDLKVTYEVHDTDSKPDGIPADRAEKIIYKDNYQISVPEIQGFTARIEYKKGSSQLSGTMPIGGIEVIVTYHRDENGNGTPDCEDDRFQITFEPGQNGTIVGADESGNVTVKDILDGLTFGTQVTIPEVKPDEGYHFAGWTPSLPDKNAKVESNQTYTAVFEPNNYEIAVNYKTDDGSVIEGMPEDYTTSKVFGTDYTVDIPDFEGYITNITGQTEGKVPVGGVNVTVIYQRDANGNNIPDAEEEHYDIRFTAGDNGQLNNGQQTEFKGILTGLDFYENVTVPEATANRGYTFTGFTPVLPEQGAKVTQSVVYEAQFTKNSYKVTVDYETPEGETEIPKYEQDVPYGDNYDVETPVIPGYTASEEAVSGTMSDEDVTVVIHYTPNVYPLIINYVDESGAVLAEQYTSDVSYKAAYSVESPVIDEYTADRTTVEGNMVIDGVTADVIYAANPAQPVTPVTPTTPTTPTTPPDTTPASTNNTPITPGTIFRTITEPIASFAQAVGETVQKGVQAIVQSDDDKVPLANRKSDDHKCCILHFLIMLLALLVEIFYTRSMKKRQQRIFELREEIALTEIEIEKDEVA